MQKIVRCPACGEVIPAPSCPSCGADLVTEAVDRVLGRPASDLDQAASDRDQTSSDRDQTASDRDQTWSDRDQTSSESDQRSADDDQHSAEEDFAAGGDATTYRRTTRARERSGHDRDAVSALRDETAAGRLNAAADRDSAAARRDREAERRDALARLDDDRDDTTANLEDVRLRAEADRARAAADRAKAAEDRARAAADREAAAGERADALRRRTQSAETLRLATTDELTGAWTRDFGLQNVARELERAHRVGTTLVLAFIDVDGLKRINDSQGHLAGDALLRLVGATLRANLRPYDVIVRYGGDEFVCAMPVLRAPGARARVEQMAATLKAANPEHSITFGLAEAAPGDTLQDLIARADADLLEARRAARSDD